MAVGPGEGAFCRSQGVLRDRRQHDGEVGDLLVWVLGYPHALKGAAGGADISLVVVPGQGTPAPVWVAATDADALGHVLDPLTG